MTVAHRVRIFILLAILCGPSPAYAQPAAAPDIMALVRADRWNGAALAATQATDPVAAKLVRWFRLLSPRGGSAAEITAFMADSPDWPIKSTLARRRDQTLVLEPDAAIAPSLC